MPRMDGLGPHAQSRRDLCGPNGSRVARRSGLPRRHDQSVGFHATGVKASRHSPACWRGIALSATGTIVGSFGDAPDTGGSIHLQVDSGFQFRGRGRGAAWLAHWPVKLANGTEPAGKWPTCRRVFLFLVGPPGVGWGMMRAPVGTLLGTLSGSFTA